MLLNAPVPKVEILNPDESRPSIHLNELLAQVRLDESKGETFLTEKIILAMDNINDQTLCLEIQNSWQIRYYKRAVCYEAAALICEDNLDFDTTTAGQIRGENQQVKTQALRRVVNHCIGMLNKRQRNRIKLV
ncbi:head completion/stabilization protein [Acinetobacter gerneri]|uniref:head completion/stabilization protein n=1 Tax=Acinetobacter gerneri TaxID=202952 RepID=UPI003A83E955